MLIIYLIYLFTLKPFEKCLFLRCITMRCFSFFPCRFKFLNFLLKFFFILKVHQSTVHYESLLLTKYVADKLVLDSPLILLVASSLLILSLKCKKNLRKTAKRMFLFKPSISTFSPSVPHARIPSKAGLAVVSECANFKKVFQSFL